MESTDVKPETNAPYQIITCPLVLDGPRFCFESICLLEF